MGEGERVRRLTPQQEAVFPRLAEADYEVTSEASTQYNCVAYAAGDTSRKWDCPPVPQPGYYWPPDAQCGQDVEALRNAFESIGYQICENGELEEGFDKIALYADAGGEWQHAAKQVGLGHWSSKLGDWEDIRHATVEAISGSDYGEVTCYMRRRRPST
jgi:hypothetical protein